jgi:SSS family transporter
MNLLDYALVVFYLSLMLWLGHRFKKSEKNTDYFLGGRQFGWFSLCMSAMATQLSAISFISAPAFVGLRPGGGMQWLTFELAVPLAMIVVMVTVGPTLRSSGVVSIYGFLEKRFGPGSRLLVSGIFVLSRSFGTGVGIYTIGLVLSSIVGVPFWQTMLVLGGVTVVYSLEGGMKAIVYSEVAQMIIKVLGIFAIMVAALYYMGGWGEFVAHVDRHRLVAIDFSKTGFDGSEFGFWPMLIGGLFLYASYYGTDQTQAQRILSAKDLPTVRQLLLFNGLLRFPITLAYCLGGLILGTFALTNAEFGAKVLGGRPDLMIPVFITDYLPHGVIGLLVVALIAAWMSSYSSTLNSLTAVTIEDFIAPRFKIPPEKYIGLSKAIALGWGALTMISGFFAGKIAATAIEAINKIGSMFYGPILAMFLLAALSRRARPLAVNIGVVAGVAVNLILWLFFKNVFWFWWNAIGAVVTILVALILSSLLPADQTAALATAAASQPATAVERTPWTMVAVLIGWFVLIVSFCLLLPRLI